MSQNIPGGLSQIGQISVGVSDLPRAVGFYRDALNMKYLFTAGTMAFFDCGGVRLMLGMPEKPGADHPSSVIYFKVPKAAEMYEVLRTRGVQFVGEPHLVARLEAHDLWMAFFHDSEGNLMAV